MRAATKCDYEVGYGKPPRGTGFKKGQSGNPRGRPPHSKNLTTLLNDTLNEPVTITEDDRRRKITKREAVIKTLINKSASADPRSLKKLPRNRWSSASAPLAPLPSAASKTVNPSSIAPVIASTSANRPRKPSSWLRHPVASAAAKPSRMRATAFRLFPLWAKAQP
jgi:hypothetical protein